MKRRGSEVNGRAMRARKGARFSPTVLSIAVACVVFASACGGSERRAERLYREASRLVERGEYAEAVKRLDTIVRDYPDSDTAVRARREVVIYRGLSEAVVAFPVRRSVDAVVQVARALDRFRASRGQWPEGLDHLVPAQMSALPRDGWGRDLHYERRGKGYRLACLGSDDTEGGDGDAADIVVENGSFVKGDPR